mgnify:FL=1
MMKNNYRATRISLQTSKNFDPPMNKIVGFLAVILFVIIYSTHALAADFQVQPTTMDLGGKVKSGVFSVINNSNEKIDFQVSVKAWNQDENSKDAYTDTNDIVFFPKVMSIDPNSQRAVRIGLKTPPGAREKTYRLFVQEIPTQKKTQDIDVNQKVKAGVTIAFRFSMPIFVKPLKPQEIYAIDKVEMAAGKARAVVKNTGNVHVKLRSVTFSGKAADGKELYSKEVAGWYILNGMSSSYEAEIPKDVCGQLAKIDINVRTEDKDISGILNVQKNMCPE